MTRRTTASGIALVLAAFFLIDPVVAGGDANFLLGVKSLDEDNWAPVEDHVAFGAEVTFGKETWPIWIALDYFESAREKKDVPIDLGGFVVARDLEGNTLELDLGVRKIWGQGWGKEKRTRPYLGGGVGLMGAHFDAEFSSDEDFSLGVWAGGGIFWRLGSRFNIGATVRWSKAQVELFGVDGEAGGLTYGLLLGWGWPAGS